jgi:hypothetical protein
MENNTTICTICHKNFICNVSNISNCWCAEYPNVLDVSTSESCLCQECLQLQIQKKTLAIAESFTIENALENNWVKDLPKQKNVQLNIDYYMENNFYVFTKWHHLKRGYCCKNNCRHCAYGFKK